MDIKKTLIRGGVYVAGANVIGQIVAVGVNVLLARLLLPEDFGLIALASTYIGFISLFSAVGFGSSIIYFKELDNKQLSSLYWLNWVFAAFTYLLVVSTSSWISTFYGQSELRDIVILSGVSILISPLFSLHYKLLERELKFKILSIWNLVCTVLGGSAGIIAALLGLGVYSLVLQTLVTILAKSIVYLRIIRWRPIIYFDYNGVKAMIWYAVKYKMSNSVLYIERNLDYLVLGKQFPSKVIGYYSFAYNIMYAPVKRVSYLFSNMLFPALSTIKDDHSRLIHMFFKSVSLIAMVSFPAMAILSFNANFLIPFVFGAQWNSAIPIVQVLCFAGAIQSVSQPGAVVFPALGKPEISIYLSIIRTLLTVGAILIGARYGILVVAYGLVVAKFSSFVLTIIVMRLQIEFNILQMLGYMLGSTVTVGALVVLQSCCKSMEPIYLLSLMIFIAVVMITIFYHGTIRRVISVLWQKQ